MVKKKKKQDQGISWYAFDLCFVAVIIIVILAIILTVVSDRGMDKSCVEGGFEKYEYKSDFNFCIDYEGNYHFIEKERVGLFQFKIKEISVGDVIIKNG